MTKTQTHGAWYHEGNRAARMSGLTVGLLGFVLLLTEATSPGVGAALAFAGINVAYFAEWNLMCEHTCAAD